jgi:hypothetical protein
MFESTIAAGLRRPTHHLRWFLVGGGIGFLTAIFCATNLGQHVLPEKLWMSLWPMGIALMAVDNAHMEATSSYTGSSLYLFL